MEKAYGRELSRLQSFQSFLVAQIDQLANHAHDSDALTRAVTDMKYSIETFSTRLFDDRSEGGHKSNSIRDLVELKEFKDSGTQSLGLGYIEEQYNHKKEIETLRARGKKLKKDLVYTQKERKLDQEEIKESMKDANNKFNEAYKELQQHNMALKSESLDAKADLLDKIEELKRIKGLALKRAQGSSNGDSQPDSMASMIERQRWEIADLKQEKVGLVQKLRRYKVKGNIIERQKNEIVRLNKYIHKVSNEHSQSTALQASPIRAPRPDFGINMSAHSLDHGQDTQWGGDAAPNLVTNVLRKNARLKGLNHTLAAQRDQLRQSEQSLKNQLTALTTSLQKNVKPQKNKGGSNNFYRNSSEENIRRRHMHHRRKRKRGSYGRHISDAAFARHGHDKHRRSQPEYTNHRSVRETTVGFTPNSSFPSIH